MQKLTASRPRVPRVLQLESKLRFCCPSCAYVHEVRQTITKRMNTEQKEVDDVLGDRQAWEHRERASGEHSPPSSAEQHAPVISAPCRGGPSVVVVCVRRSPHFSPAVRCPVCPHDEAYFSQVQIRSSDEPMTIFYRCVKCFHPWREG